MNTNVAENYGWSTAQADPSGAYLVPKIFSLLKQLNAKRVLDLGAGNGAVCGRLKAAGYDVVGVEYDKSGVEISRATHPGINFYNFGVQDNPAELLATESAFDAVISTEVVEHLFSPHLLPVYASGVLRPGGYLIATTPYHGYLKNLALSIFDHWDKHHDPLWHGGHVKFWSRKTLSKLFSDNGFRVVGFSGVGRFQYLWASMVLVGQKI